MIRYLSSIIIASFLAFSLLSACLSSDMETQAGQHSIKVIAGKDTDYDYFIFRPMHKPDQLLFGLGGIHIRSRPLILYGDEQTEIIVPQVLDYMNDVTGDVENQDISLGYYRFLIGSDWEHKAFYCEYILTEEGERDLIMWERKHQDEEGHKIAEYALNNIQKAQSTIREKSICRARKPLASDGFYY